MWTSWIVAGLYFIFIMCNLKSLRIAIAVFDTESDFVEDTKRILLVPLIFSLIAAAMFFVGLYALACVSSIGTITGDSYILQTKDVERTDVFFWMIFAMGCGILWIVQFIMDTN